MTKNLKGKIKLCLITFIKYILIFVILISIYLVTLIASSMIPSTTIKQHVTESSEVLKQDGEKKQVDVGYKKEILFTFTDALMINTAYSIDSNNPINSFMLDRTNYIPGQTLNIHTDSQYDLLAAPEYVAYKNGEYDVYQTQQLYGLMHGDNIVDSFEYARYWHGYLTILRPLLVLANYQTIRIIMLILTIILVLIILYFIYKKINLITAIIFLIGFASIHLFVVTQSFNEIMVYIISLITSIYILLKKDKIKSIGIVFFVTGSLTSFFDLLTAPLVTLGLPLILWILLMQKDGIKLKDITKQFIKICICWTIGYALTWATKWVITQVFFNRPIIQESLTQAKFRGKLPKGNSFMICIKRMLVFLNMNTIIVIANLLFAYLIISFIIKIQKLRKINFQQNLKECVPYIFTGILPILWYYIIQEHSYMHAFFTYRIYILTIISISIIASKILQIKKVSKTTQ